ncbi:MAG: amino acid permease [Gammaproteobacteria bacterium]|nr:MAG: amino acid permease [Gammaproteobacteria bacterium]
MQLRPHNHTAVCTVTGPHSVTLAAMASREIVSAFELQPRRDLTLLHATSLVVGITIGTGIFLKSAVMAQAVGTPLLVLAAWVVAGLVAMLGALSFAELGALLPDAGGEYVYLRAAFGEVPGFLYVFNSFLVGGASISAYGAAVAIFLSDIYAFDRVWFERTLHVLGASYTLQSGVRQLIAVGVIALFATINCAGVMLSGRVQTILTAAKVLSIAGVAGGVFLCSGTHDWSNLATPPGANSGGLSGFGAALFAALWAYSGWQFLPMAASEVQRPERNLPRAIIGGTLLVLATYMLINVAYLYALPFWQIATSNSTAYPEAPSVAARTVQTFLGTHAAPIAALIFLVSCTGALNGTILARARVPYAAARDGLFFAAFGRLSPHSRVPVTSIVLVSIWAALLAASGTFDQLTNMAVLSYAIFWIPVVLAVIVLRNKLPHALRPYRVWGYPLVPLVFALVMGWILVNAFITSTTESIATLALILLGLPLYPLFRKGRAAAPRLEPERSD